MKIFGICFVVVVAAINYTPKPAPAVIVPVAMAASAAAAQPAPADECVATTNGNPCVPNSKIFEMMDKQPDTPEVIPPNPAASDEETI